jgi:2-hydroxy-4-carboxymuconate semialdehyde hemiacetal dehydrogenase
LDYKDLLANSEIQSIIVATPSYAHAQITCDALLASKSVLCEIPIALSFQETAAILQLSKKRNLVVAVAHTLRYSPLHCKLKEILTAGEYLPQSVLIRNLRFRQENIDWTGVHRDWTDSVLWHHGAHALDLGLWLLDPIEPIVDIEPGPLWTNGLSMEICGRIKSIDNRFSSINVSYHSQHEKNDVLVITEKDTFEISDDVLVQNGRQILDGREPGWLVSESMRKQNRTFFEAINSQDYSHLFTVNDALPVMRYLQAAQDFLDK